MSNQNETSYNFKSVKEGELYRSAQPSREFLLYLKEKYKIKTIINLRTRINLPEKEFAKENNINLFQIPLSHFAIGLNKKKVLFFLNLIEDKNNFPVLIHCRQGKDRTGVMIALFRLFCQKWEWKDVYSEIKENKVNLFWRLSIRTKRLWRL